VEEEVVVLVAVGAVELPVGVATLVGAAPRAQEAAQEPEVGQAEAAAGAPPAARAGLGELPARAPIPDSVI